MVLAKEQYGLRERSMGELHARFIPFSAQTRMSGVDIDGASIRKGAVDSIVANVHQVTRGSNVPIPAQLSDAAERISRSFMPRTLGAAQPLDAVLGRTHRRLIPSWIR